MTNRSIKAFRVSAKDQIRFELIKGALTGARREMEALITRTSMSPFIREKKDFFTAILSRDGELFVSTSLSLAGYLLDSVLETYPSETMLDGDILVQRSLLYEGSCKPSARYGIYYAGLFL